MKAALFQRGGKFVLAERPDPVPGPGEVVVAMAYCGICGSDVHMVERGMLPSGAVIGHEQAGTIAAVGPDVTGWAEGDPVAVMPLDPCGTCAFCRRGDTQQCSDGLKRSYGLGANPGGFAQFMRVKTSMLYRIPDGLDLQTAALNEPWAVARRGVNMLDLDPDAPVLVMGAGPIGLLSLYALKRKGARHVFVSEPDPFRAERARAAGAIRVIDPKAAKPIVVILKEAGRPPEAVIDCAGTEASTMEAVSTVSGGGTVLVLGIHLGKIGILPIVCSAKEVAIKFSFGYTAVEFGESLLLLAQGAVNPQVLVSAILPLRQLDEAFHLLKAPGHGKILIDCREV